MSKLILDLCGGTGSWSKPYKEAGYDVRVITLPHYDLFETVERERECLNFIITRLAKLKSSMPMKSMVFSALRPVRCSLLLAPLRRLHETSQAVCGW